MRIQIGPDRTVVLKLPLRQSEAGARRFLRENAAWVTDTLAAQPMVPPLRDYLARHPRLSLNGNWHRLELAFDPAGGRYRIEPAERRVRCFLDPCTDAEVQVRSLLMRIAGDCLPARLRLLAGKTGTRVHGVTIRDQKSRWGSCSETGGISLNWRLILLPPALQDHVLLHELAHLRHFDHSPDFHSFLATLDPRARDNARRLDTIGAPIFSLGRTQR
jgi:predicted metal-dependent hydrolase